ncbi:hypothetical protein [Streptomyces sp. NBC_01429]|uniref:hypothetical protein n=1 Tax=Streptomyces sp. NBC_01429 TaxID=2903862 RepID=UPI002E2BEB92|nr:hypothetical protein [Streptomyces sp. NBC_01429]
MLVTVVLALTGFSSSSKSRSRGSSHGGSGSGGGSGCSSPERGNGSSSSSSSGSSGSGSGYHSGSGTRHDSDDDHDDTSSSGSTSTADGVEARIVTCVRKARGKRKAVTYATVRVEAGRASTETYDIDVTFTDAAGSYVDFGDAEVTLDSGETRTVRVPMDTPREVTRVRKCEVDATVA